ncbi:hypothetical protein JCGZ_23694 [Jatropha curcas]|uniref:Uncharacterized protein n=1 Tax=Jatropha curcas TaxID=180498 RepID=A0A067LFA4_JATCU|nr:hypothetical protein JCGZ_23694 [Jatropha curcas]
MEEMKRSAPPFTLQPPETVWIARNFITQHRSSSSRVLSRFRLLPRKSRSQTSSSHCEDEVGMLGYWISWPVA